MNTILTTTDLTFAYRNDIVVRNVNLSVPEQSIYGFVGPNGAGKSTTIKLLLGLLTPKEGAVSIYGKDLQRHRTEVLRSIGSLVEVPSLYPHLTAEENLDVIRKVYSVPVSTIENVLHNAGIGYAKKKKVKEFSLGMKQRLGIAMSLLHSPKLLILDEPINGLDPEGIQEFRYFLKQLVRENGITILLSSHILSELEQVATVVGIIAKGTIQFQGSLDELKQRSTREIIFSVSDIDRSEHVLTSLNVVNKRRADGKLVVPFVDKTTIASINANLVRSGVDVYEIFSEQPNLESVFLEIIQSRENQ